MPREKIGQIRSVILHAEDLLNCSYEDLARMFLARYLQIEHPFNDIDMIRKTFIEQVLLDIKNGNLKIDNSPFKKAEEVPTLFEKFIEFIVFKVLHLHYEPKAVYYKIYSECFRQTRTIHNNIKNLNNDIHSLKNKLKKYKETSKSQNITPDDIQQTNTDIELAKHLLEQNESTLKEIGKFLIDKPTLNRIIFTKCLTPLFYRQDPPRFYNFHGNEKLLKKRDWKGLIYEFTKHFGSELTPEHFNSLNFEGLSTELSNLMTKKKLVNDIKTNVREHHITLKKEREITDCVNSYKDGYELSAAHLVPAIIEGLCHELCQELGLNSDKVGLRAKLKMVSERAYLDIFDYEFLIFMLTVYRNQMAHGGSLADGEYKYIPKLMMLALHRFTNHIIWNVGTPSNIRLFHLQQILKIDINDFRRIDRTIQLLILLEKQKIPAFYNVEKEIEVLKSLLNSRTYISHIKNIYEDKDISPEINRIKLTMMLNKNGVKGIDFKKYAKKKKTK